MLAVARRLRHDANCCWADCVCSAVLRVVVGGLGHEGMKLISRRLLIRLRLYRAVLVLTMLVLGTVVVTFELQLRNKLVPDLSRTWRRLSTLQVRIVDSSWLWRHVACYGVRYRYARDIRKVNFWQLGKQVKFIFWPTLQALETTIDISGVSSKGTWICDCALENQA